MSDLVESASLEIIASLEAELRAARTANAALHAEVDEIHRRVLMGELPIDCRTCGNFSGAGHSGGGSCKAAVECIDGTGYKRNRFVRLWRS